MEMVLFEKFGIYIFIMQYYTVCFTLNNHQIYSMINACIFIKYWNKNQMVVSGKSDAEIKTVKIAMQLFIDVIFQNG